ncbi:Hypothetical protein D9617_12g037490 [Elsinoe fawcettii]|nr:Hypothetical protein D9617_12g037490 [Elsinoe fawcettii]
MLKYALKYPYLMSITLAVTALRQTMDEPRNAATLCDQATELFGRGISDLNIAIQNIHEGNIGAIFLSSSMTGKYMLCDTFIVQRQESPGAFLNRIIDTMRVARGVRAIMNDGHYILLAGSELRPMLGFNLQDIFDVDDDEDDEMMHFRALYELVKQSSLAEDEMEACRVAIAQLMRTYCSKSSSLHLRRASRFIRGRAWPIATTPLFTDMLERRVPEALVILGHWSVLLHCISDIWAIGDAPNLLMDCVRVALGTSWDGHLAWARDFISRPVPDTLL